MSVIELHNRSVLHSLEEGDMVEFERSGYSHWGIYVGNEEIVHLTGNADVTSGSSHPGSSCSSCGKLAGKATVRKDNFWNVTKGHKANKNNSKDRKLTPLRVAEIVSAALSKIGEVGYNIFFNNCEHFASFCRYGKKWSEQADTALTGIAYGAAAAAVGGLLYNAFGGNKKQS